MSSLITIILFATALVAIFVLAISITLIVKGRNIESEIGANENMKRLGIKCTAQQMRNEERILSGEAMCDLPFDCHDASCGTCAMGVVGEAESAKIEANRE